jgi:hypothetical protein
MRHQADNPQADIRSFSAFRIRKTPRMRNGYIRRFLSLSSVRTECKTQACVRATITGDEAMTQCFHADLGTPI